MAHLGLSHGTLVHCDTVVKKQYSLDITDSEKCDRGTAVQCFCV